MLRGRPSTNANQQMCSHKDQKSEEYKEFWTEHRITLISYEAQYVNNKKPEVSMDNIQMAELSQRDIKSKKKRKNVQYESGFLFAKSDIVEQINLTKEIEDYQNLYWLYNSATDEGFCQVKEFMTVMLQLKSQCIIKQFCEIYAIIINQLKPLYFTDVEKQQNRFEWLNIVKNKVILFIQSHPEKFPYMKSYLKEDRKQTEKLFKVEAYCFLAERFNFNINEYYSQAFSIVMQNKKKIKTE